ncbi:hypothetical protein GCM10023156_46030 [Novipirellula rosea]|uniref:Uncharacterized protein n=1 Tax=Novipirellula rosea TaxID=1031540 RepID=A0ABP8N6V3_9BACT
MTLRSELTSLKRCDKVGSCVATVLAIVDHRRLFRARASVAILKGGAMLNDFAAAKIKVKSLHRTCQI